MPSVPFKWDEGEDEDSSESNSQESEQQESQDEDESSSDDDDEPSTIKSRPRAKQAAKAKGAKPAAPKAKSAKKVKNEKTKAKKTTSGKKKRGGGKESRTSHKGDKQIFRYSAWRAVPEFHLKDFLTSAEPKTASSMKVSELSSRELRRVFFAFFRQPPGKKPDKKEKGEIRKDLLNEYESLGRPGHGKTLHKVCSEVEDELSKNLEFKVEKVGKIYWLHCGKKKVQLPDKPWKCEIFTEPTTNIPFISDGKTSTRCLHFFHEEEPKRATPGNPSQAEPEVPKKVLKPLPVPLPGCAANTEAEPSESGQPPHKREEDSTGDKPVCYCNYHREVCEECGKGYMTELNAGRACKIGDGTGPPMPDDSPSSVEPALPDSDDSDTEPVDITEDAVDGYKVHCLPDGRVYLCHHSFEVTFNDLGHDHQDAKLTKHTASGKHQGEIFLHSPSGKFKSRWVSKVPLETISPEDLQTIRVACKESKVKKSKDQDKGEDHKKNDAEDERKKKEAEEEESRQKEEAEAKKKKTAEEERLAKEIEQKTKTEKAAEEERKIKEAEEEEERKRKQKEREQMKAEIMQELERQEAEKEARKKKEQEGMLSKKPEEENLQKEAEDERLKKEAEDERLKKEAEDERLKKEAEDERLKKEAEDERLKKGAEDERLKKEAEDERLKKEAEDERLKKEAEENEKKKKEEEEKKKKEDDIIRENREKAKKRKEDAEAERASKKVKVPR